MIRTIKKLISSSALFPAATHIKAPEEAYDLWSEDYDAQPGNLMLDLDEEVFFTLLQDIDLRNQRVADIGCGTGRHWSKIFAREPLSLTGFDLSAGMLLQLQQKFPGANTCKIRDNRFSDVADGLYDVLISTLTIAHIKNLEETLQSWSRILKADAEMIITDFHPDALARGGRRTFRHQQRSLQVRNYVHPLAEIEKILKQHGFQLVSRLERVVEEQLKHYYEAKNALHVYKKFENSAIIYGLHLRRMAI